VVVPFRGRLFPNTGLVRGLRGVHIAVLNHDTDDAEGIGNNGALRRPDDIDLATEHEYQCSDKKDAQAEEIRGPEVDIAFHVWSSEQGERADVDTPVEDHVDSLYGDCRVDDDALASLVIVTNDHLPPFVLIGDEGSNVGLDATGSKTDDKNSSNEATETCAVIEGCWDGCAGEDQETGHVDETKDYDGVVLSEILVGNDGTEDRCDWSTVSH